MTHNAKATNTRATPSVHCCGSPEGVTASRAPPAGVIGGTRHPEGLFGEARRVGPSVRPMPWLAPRPDPLPPPPFDDRVHGAPDMPLHGRRRRRDPERSTVNPVQVTPDAER